MVWGSLSEFITIWSVWTSQILTNKPYLMCEIKKTGLLRVWMYTKSQGLAAEGTSCQMGKTLK